jgi:TldD protein
VSDTPSLTMYDGKPVPGAYRVDDEGVPAKDVSLVENGKLITLLTSRTPQKKLLHSNGHGRSGNVQAGVFQMRSSQAVPASELKKKYLEVLKDQDKTYGYIVRGVAGAGGPGGSGAAPLIPRVVKVTLDGTEEPVRGLRFAPIASTVFRNILDASVERPLYSYLSGAGDVVSVIAPSLIFEELEIQQTKDISQKPPIVPSPLTK